MYGVSLERIPLPSFSTYLFFSLFSFFGSLIYLIHDVYTGLSPESSAVVTFNFDPLSSSGSTNTGNVTSDFLPPAFQKLANVCTKDTWCFWSIINLAYCALIIIGKTSQNLFFGELRGPEQQLIRDKFWNFVFYKLVFIYGILNVETLHDLSLWAGWSSILGFLHLLTHLTKDRFEFVAQAPSITVLQHVRLILLLCFVLLAGTILGVVSFMVGSHSSLHIMLFMLAEVYQLQVVTIYALLRYCVHVYDKKHASWTGKTVFLYYSDLGYHVAAHGLDFVHNLHMLFWNNIKVNMTGLVIGMHLQYLYYELAKRLQRHQRYKRVVAMIEEKFPLLQDLENDCSICWERLGISRRLPCSHVFHDSCLRPWIEQNTSCPTCRFALHLPGDVMTSVEDCPIIHSTDSISSHPNTSSSAYSHSTAPAHSTPPSPVHLAERLLQSEARSLRTPATGNLRYSTCPDEVGNTMPRKKIELMDTGAILKLANQIQLMFPRIPLPVIMEELEKEGSRPEDVVVAILEGRLHAPGPHLLTGPMQVELDLRRNADFHNVIQKQLLDCLIDRDLLEASISSASSHSSHPDMTSREPTESGRWCHNSKQLREVNLTQRKVQLIADARKRFLKDSSGKKSF